MKLDTPTSGKMSDIMKADRSTGVKNVRCCEGRHIQRWKDARHYEGRQLHGCKDRSDIANVDTSTGENMPVIVQMD